MLTAYTHRRLPKLQQEVNRQLTQCYAQLEQLPQAITTEPSAHVLSLVTAFCGDVGAYVQGGSATAELVQKNRRTYTAFKYAIRGTAPAFIPYPSARDAGGDFSEFLAIEDEAEDEETEPATAVPKQKEYMYLQDVKRFIQQ